MVQMITPWKHPQTGIYYLYKELPPHLRAEMGKRQVRRSLKTRDPAEAKRLFAFALADLERDMAAAEARVAAQAVADNISPERAALVIDDFIRTRHSSDRWKRWPTLGLTYWLEEEARNTFQVKFPIGAMFFDESPESLAELRDMPLMGDAWLDLVRQKAPADWLHSSRTVLDPVFKMLDGAIKRTTTNELLIMQAWNARLRDDNARLRDDVNAPRRAGSKPRARPDLRIDELLKLWGEEKKPRPQTYAEARNAVNDFIDYIGDVAVSALTSDMLMDYRDEAKRLPRTMPRADRALPFRERLALHAATSLPRVTPTTLKKRIGAIQALLSFAHQERWIEHNIGAGLKITNYTRQSRSRRSFREGELAQLFSSDLFIRPDLLLKRRTKVSDLTLYWFFVLGLTSGARIEEVGQARLADVKTDVGILYIDVDDYVDEERDTQPVKSLKTEGSRRVVPIHDLAIALGFDRYVAALRALGQNMLFPDLRPNVYGKLTQEASRRANRYIDANVGDDSRIVFHSLRHHFKDRGREADVQERVLDQLCGHAPSSVGGRYGDGAGIKSLKRSLDRLSFDAVDWTPIKQAASVVDWQTVANEFVARIARTSKGAAA